MSLARWQHLTVGIDWGVLQVWSNHKNQWVPQFSTRRGGIEYATDTLLEDEKYKVLRKFTSTYGIGPMTAQTLYAHKCRTLDDLKKFYENPENAIQQSSDDDENEYEDENKRVPESWIQVSLKLKDDLSIK